MPDKPNTPFTLADHRLVVLRGTDAVRFAHAQFMSDVAALPDGQWQWSGWLTPRGRVVALFALLRLDAERVWLVLPDADPAELVAQLQRFVFRSKVVVEARPDLPVGGAFSPPLQARGNLLAGSEGAGFELDLGGDGGARVLRVGAAARAASDGVLLSQWRVADLEHGLPRLEPGQVDRWTPQQLSLERLRAFSVKKGCYPGQEIVARTHFLGKAKRGLVLLAGHAPFADGVDDVASVASAGDRHVALAVRPLEREPDPRERPLLDGLAR